MYIYVKIDVDSKSENRFEFDILVREIQAKNHRNFVGWAKKADVKI